MHITALCPYCLSAYQVEEALRGQMVRCPNASCRKVFPVAKDAPGAEPPPSPAAPVSPRPTPPSGGSRSGSVGDIVPILPTEPAPSSQEPPAASKATPEVYSFAPGEADWRQAAPPVRSRGTPPGEKPTPAPPARSRTEPERDKPTPAPRKSAAPPAGTSSDAEGWYDVSPARSAQTTPTPAPPPSPPTQMRRRPARPSAETQQMPALRPETRQMPALGPETQQMPALEPETPDQPRELPPGVWEPPPVRRGSQDEEYVAQPVEEIEEEDEEDEAPRPRVSKRLACSIIAGLVLLVLFGLGGGGLFVWKVVHVNEDQLYDQARDFYNQGSFSEAKSKFDELTKKFPSSTRFLEYGFMDDWCGECAAVSNPDADLPTVAADLDEFIRKHKKDPVMIQESRVAGERLVHLTRTLEARFPNPTDEAPLPAVESIEKVRRTMTGLLPDALTRNGSEEIDTILGKVRTAVERARKRGETLAAIRVRDNETPMDAIKRSRSLLARMERELPGINQEARALLDQLEKTHLESVVFKPAKDAPALPPPQPGEDAEILLFTPMLQSFAPVKAANDPIVLALVRGILYALKQSNGELKWATHVGIDTPVLPQRVPATAITPELLLVLSADTKTLSALNVDGGSLWEYYVGESVLGRPVIINQRAYLADYSGWVHEIELSRGQLLGRWNLGQPLTIGGAREEGTSRIYFPAVDSCIYVLDVDPKVHRCVTILYDGHPSGSLRSEPVVIPPEGDNAPGYLILNQASGLDAMRLRVFGLPLEDSHAPPLKLSTQAGLAGWTWFEPKQDGEKLAVLSDAGILGLFGIRQLGNNDQALFPLLRAGELDLSSFLHQPTGAAKGRDLSRERGRSLVAHMRSSDMWVLAHGRFQQLHLRLNPTAGPEAIAGWKTPLELGSPLHEPQRQEERNGRSTFFLVTQALNQQVCLATAVNEDGRILWQRQLGSVCQGEPLALTPPGGGPPVLLTLDQGGGLFMLDPQLPVNKLRFSQHLLAPALAENPQMPPRLLLAADGQSAYEVAAPGDGQSLVVRHIQWSGKGRDLDVVDLPRVSLSRSAGPGALTPAGRPIITSSHLLIPMLDGTVQGLALAAEQSLQTGPSWSRLQNPVAAPSILALGGDRFLSVNDGRNLAVYEWPAGKGTPWRALPIADEPLKPLEYLVAAPPALLPEEKNQPARVVVVDAVGMLRLFTVAQNGALQAGATWQLDGNLTAGPFVQETPDGWRIGCVLDRRRLIWFDPAKEKRLWEYATDGPAIVGQPQRIEDMLVIALQSGRYVGIDPKTGKARGPGYLLRTSAAPAAVPMPFGPGRMFAPLSDGTGLLLSVDLLKKG